MSTHLNSSSTLGSFVISRGWSGYYVWTLEDGDGQVVETSATRYDSYETCRQAIERLKAIASSARIDTGVAHHAERPRRGPGRRLTTRSL